MKGKLRALDFLPAEVEPNTNIKWLEGKIKCSGLSVAVLCTTRNYISAKCTNDG